MTRMTGPDCVVMCNLINTYIHTYSILVYNLLFTQALIRVCLDGTIIDSMTILVTMYYCGYVGYDWWLCMVINISVYSITVGFSPTLYC